MQCTKFGLFLAPALVAKKISHAIGQNLWTDSIDVEQTGL